MVIEEELAIYGRRFVPQENKKNGAGNETRTRDFHLGKVALYQLSYSRSLERLAFSCRVFLMRALLAGGG